jgi:hypothetical protein
MCDKCKVCKKEQPTESVPVEKSADESVILKSK